METRRPVFAVLSLYLLLTACATAPNFHMLEEARPHLDQVDVFLVVAQDEIYAQIDQSNVAAAMGGGLIPALIDAAVESSRTKTAEQMMQPIRDGLINFDYAQVLADALDAGLKGVSWLHAGNLKLLRSDEKDQLQNLYNNSSASAILYITGDYSLSANMHSAVTVVNLALYPKSESLFTYREKPDKNGKPVDLSDNIYRNRVEHASILISDPDKKPEESAQMLADEGPGRIIDALNANARQVADLVKQDIAVPGSRDKK